MPPTARASKSEQDVRIELAGCYRLFHHLGWTELIFNHITAKLPGPDRYFLINPFGLHYNEVTASNLVKLDLAGNIIGASSFPYNPAGYPLHSAIHEARPEIACIAHTHTTAGLAIACLEEGIDQHNFYGAMLRGQVAYHAFEGITLYGEEKSRMVESLSDKSCLVLRNHGLVACGRSVAEAFARLWTMQRACEVQLAARSTGRPVVPVADAVAEKCGRDSLNVDPSGQAAEIVFQAMMRQVDAHDTSYRN
ncbi:MAG: class II aldolase/adducin family protein [Alphaproteobacteria bacterium]|nr:class II aldolase/adducin family protein [Alphaproteobacteria bacterium]